MLVSKYLIFFEILKIIEKMKTLMAMNMSWGLPEKNNWNKTGEDKNIRIRVYLFLILFKWILLLINEYIMAIAIKFKKIGKLKFLITKPNKYIDSPGP